MDYIVVVFNNEVVEIMAKFRQQKMELLSNELRVGVEIFRANEELRKPVYFTLLVDQLKDVMSRSTVSKSIDILFDLGMLRADWEMVNGNWARTLKIANEAKDFLQKMSDNVK